MSVIIVKDGKETTFKGAILKDGGIWVNSTKGVLPLCDSTLLKAKGLDPKAVAASGAMDKHPDCWLKLGQNPGGATAYLLGDYHKLKEAERLTEREVDMQSHVVANTVKLQRHEYADTEWYLCYGKIQQRIYPDGDISLSRDPDETYMAGVRWMLAEAEYQQLSAISTTKPEPPQYDLTEPTGIPEGVNEICQAQDAWHRAESVYERAHEREQIAPYPTDKDYRAAISNYPRAALYLTCESYIVAANHHKVSAGEQARNLLLQGGKAVDVQAILDNWLPPSAMWD